MNVAYATADGTAVAPGDYASASGTLSFAPGITSQTVTVAVNGDNALEGNEAFTVSLSAPTGATLGDATGVGTILDDDPAASVGDATVYEGHTGTRTAVFTATLSKPSTSTVTLGYTTADGTAVAGEDYTAKTGSLSFAPGVTSMAVKVAVMGDELNEDSAEIFTLSLTSASGAAIGDATGAGLILDDDPTNISGRRLTIGDVTIHEGDAGTRDAVFNVSLSESSGSTITVDFATAKATATRADFVARTGKISFAPGTTSVNLKIAITPDTTVEGNENFTVALSGLTGGGTLLSDGTGSATIIDND